MHNCIRFGHAIEGTALHTDSYPRSNRRSLFPRSTYCTLLPPCILETLVLDHLAPSLKPLHFKHGDTRHKCRSSMMEIVETNQTWWKCDVFVRTSVDMRGWVGRIYPAGCIRGPKRGSSIVIVICIKKVGNNNDKFPMIISPPGRGPLQ
jgi:hypothetical protein